MDNDQRDRRDGPEPDSTADDPAADQTEFGDASRAAGDPSEAGAGPDEAPLESPYEPPIESTTEPEPSTESEPSAEPEPIAPDVSEPSPSAAEIESWPSQDAASASRESDPVLEPVLEPAEERAWPTEPPAADSGSTDTWPTTPPERGSEPPPGEVEAYPAATTPDPDAAAMAAAGAAATAAHSVPEAEGSTGESTQCPRCGTENRPGLAFCANCGQRLVAAGVSTIVERPGAPEGTMACPRCGTHNRAGVAFCQNCGANLRGTSTGYVPPAVAAEGEAVVVETERRGAVLGPVVLLIGIVGLITAYLLPFLYGNGSLFERGFGADGYGAAFWARYPDVGAGLADQAYFGLAAPVPLFVLLLGLLAIGGFMRARPGIVQTVGLTISLLWSVGLAVLFVVVELAGNWDGDLVGVLRVLTPAGIIFFLSSLIVLIGTLTRFGRS
ncbi:MAG: zinc-ribbon domain-containing protein [Candidatus Limnocylindria bacterium]